jgi:acyl-CoA thioesterase-1
MNKTTLTGILFAALAIAGCGDGSKSSNNNLAPAAEAAKTDSASKKIVLFFGDSLTAGYGLDDPADAFPGVISRRVDSLKLPYKVINAGLSGETTAGGNGRINWLLKQKIDIFILELGANDGLRGIPVNETAKNLQAIVDKVKAKYPDAKLVLLGMQVPPNMGADYSGKFKSVFPDLAAKNKMELVPFLLKDVAGIPSLNQGDGIHPTAQGAKIVANNVWAVLKDDLK